MTRSERIRVTIVSCLLGVGTLVAIASLAGLGPDELRARLLARPEDGNWSVLSIDGRVLPKAGYLVGIREGHVRQGRDGCNMWSYDNSGSERMMMTTLQGCSENAVTAAYWVIVRNPTPVLIGEHRLRIVAGDHTAELRRCRWHTVRRVTPDSVSEARECELQ